MINRQRILSVAIALAAVGTSLAQTKPVHEQMRDEHLQEWQNAEKLTPQEREELQMVVNRVEAPAFTLKDLQGKDVSLSDFRGKWVILDFWGSWCVWCVKGIPEMKKMYEKYHDRGLEIIGIDCNEPAENWRAGVEKYGLPWVNVYNPAPRGEGITLDYHVPGYPTKVIVDPEGRIFDIVVGEDPAFYDLVGSIFDPEAYTADELTPATPAD